MNEDGMVFIGFSDCVYPLEASWIHFGTHPLVEEKVIYHPTFAGFVANLAGLKYRNAGQSASQT